MSEVWKVILSLSLSGTVLMGMLLLFCRIFQRKLSRGWQYYIWLAVVARLLIPFSGELNLTGSVFAKLEQSAGQENLPVAEEPHAGQENLPAGTEQDVGRLPESVDISQEREITSVLQPEDAGRNAATPDLQEHVFD
ncbi:MAG: M56 family metallopeptidase, partial [Lachnospiraceae bacterium]|nr:M56 family metallopeptidase [Lachnospiraceae bacterium]